MKNLNFKVQDLNFIDFVRHPLVLNDQSMSPAQVTFSKSIYGLELDDVELEIYRRGTGRNTYVSRVRQEATLIGGRQGGKTKLSARIAIFEACRDHRIPRGQRAYVMIVAPVIAQAKIAFDSISNFLHSSPLLSSKIRRIRGTEIELTNGIVIGCYACSRITVRGRAAVAIICDELCFWRNEVTSVSNDEEVLAALRPSMATFPKGKLIKISTPNVKCGVAYDEFQRRGELEHDVWQLSTQELNPTISNEFLEAERKANPKNYAREYLAQFVDGVASWIEPEVLYRCVIRGRKELPRVPGVAYAAATDPGYKRSDFGMAVAHRADDGLIVVDCVLSWTGSKRAPLGFQWVCGQVAGILRRYDINVVKGDQFCAVPTRGEFLKLGISYDEFIFTRSKRAQLFYVLKYLIEQQLIELPDHPELLRQLRSLVERRSGDGNIDIRPPAGQKDDLAVALALCVHDLSQSVNNPAPKISFGRVSRWWEGFLPDAKRDQGSFTIREFDCPKFPNCVDTGTCTCCR